MTDARTMLAGALKAKRELFMRAYPPPGSLRIEVDLARREHLLVRFLRTADPAARLTPEGRFEPIPALGDGARPRLAGMPIYAIDSDEPIARVAWVETSRPRVTRRGLEQIEGRYFVDMQGWEL